MDLPEDVILEILTKLKHSEFKKLCSSSEKIKKICKRNEKYLLQNRRTDVKVGDMLYIKYDTKNKDYKGNSKTEVIFGKIVKINKNKVNLELELYTHKIEYMDFKLQRQYIFKEEYKPFVATDKKIEVNKFTLKIKESDFKEIPKSYYQIPKEEKNYTWKKYDGNVIVVSELKI